MIKVVSSFFIMMVIISAGTVYSLKEATDQLEARKQQLSANILKDRAAIKVLRAEMAYLSQPERLQKLSQRFLVLSPYGSDQMAQRITSIATRENQKKVALSADDFPILLPQEKPAFQEKKPAFQGKKTGSKAILVSYPTENIHKPHKEKEKKIDFYERISLKLEEEK